MISEVDLKELNEEDRREQIAPEEQYCEGCGCLLPDDREVFCARCE